MGGNTMFFLAFAHPRPEAIMTLFGLRISVVSGTRGTVEGVLRRVAIGGSPNLASPREERVFEFEIGEGRSKDDISSFQDFPLHAVHYLAPNRIYVDLEVDESDLSSLQFEAQIQEIGRLEKSSEHILLERVLNPKELRS